MNNIDDIVINIFADGADLDSIKKLNKESYICGFTTNPSLMKKAGIKDYKNLIFHQSSQLHWQGPPSPNEHVFLKMH